MKAKRICALGLPCETSQSLSAQLLLGVFKEQFGIIAPAVKFHDVFDKHPLSRAKVFDEQPLSRPERLGFFGTERSPFNFTFRTTPERCASPDAYEEYSLYEEYNLYVFVRPDYISALKQHIIVLSDSEVAKQKTVPVSVTSFYPGGQFKRVWICNDSIYAIPPGLRDEEASSLVKLAALDDRDKLERVKQYASIIDQVESKSAMINKRQISEQVQMVVWHRDGGKCRRCGGTEHLEFDHIIPVAKGGSNTEKNIQLLCATCNRRKSDKIGF